MHLSCSRWAQTPTMSGRRVSAARGIRTWPLCKGVEAAACWSLDRLKSLHDHSHSHHHALHFCFDIFTTFFWHLTPHSPPCNVFVLSHPSITGDGFLTRYGCCSEQRRAGLLSFHSVTDLHQGYVPGKLMLLAFFQRQDLFLSLCFLLVHIVRSTINTY